MEIMENIKQQQESTAGLWTEGGGGWGGGDRSERAQGLQMSQSQDFVPILPLSGYITE